jgi:hypothetical protein
MFNQSKTFTGQQINQLLLECVVCEWLLLVGDVKWPVSLMGHVVTDRWRGETRKFVYVKCNTEAHSCKQRCSG